MNGGPLAHPFDADHSGSAADLAALLGGKGAGLASMTAMGFPVPPGFTLTTEACRIHLASGWNAELDAAVRDGLGDLERRTGKRLGSTTAPLLVSVRSGAAASMPGMMDTVLNVGMTAAVEAALADATGDAGFAADTRRRAVLNYAEVVGGEVPSDPGDQVVAAVHAVFESWSSDRATRYRQVEGIADDLGTAATVQAMVFGNLGDDSGTGVAFSRDPSTGAPGLMGDFLPHAQGEDVVSGRHETRPIADMAALLPGPYADLVRLAERLERHHADAVDIEFTVEQGKLWLLQARPAKRSPIATFRMAIAMAEDESFPVDRAEAVRRCGPHLDDPPTIDDGGAAVDGDTEPIAIGLAASPGRASGVLCVDVDDAVRRAESGVDVVLVRRETSPSDVAGMAAAVGLVTTLGGLVSHAAVVARSWGLPAVVGATDIEITDDAISGPGGRVAVGSVITVDGDRGVVLAGAHSTSRSEAPEVATIRSWARALDARPAPESADAGGGPVLDDIRFAVLHGLRIKGVVTIETLMSTTGADADALRPDLDDLVAAGHADFIAAREMYRITAPGRDAHRDVLAAASSARDLSGLAYDDFLALNDELKRLCTDWQVRDGEANDHSDEEYDAAILAGLCDLDDRAQPIVMSFTAVLPWTARYGPRLAAARRRFVEGDPKSFTGVMCESYHDVWMELHEDLILTLGIDRTVEGST